MAVEGTEEKKGKEPGQRCGHRTVREACMRRNWDPADWEPAVLRSWIPRREDGSTDGRGTREAQSGQKELDLKPGPAD